MRNNRRSAVSWALGVGVPLLALATVLTCFSVRTLSRSSGWVIHTHQVLERLTATVAALMEAETAQRGYLITASPAYLQTYQEVRRRIPSAVSDVGELTADNRAQQAALIPLRSLIDRRLALADQTIALEAQGRHEEATRLVLASTGRNLMEEIQARTTAMQAEEERLLGERTSAVKGATSGVVVAVSTTGLLSIALLVLLYRLSKREIARLRANELERSKQERRLEEQARLLDLSSDAIIVRDPTDHVTYWSRGACELYGFSQEEACGRVAHELLGTQVTAGLDRIQAILIASGRWTGELEHGTADGRRIVTWSRWVADRDSNGQIRAILETNSDISDRRRAEEALRQANVELEEFSADLERRVETRTRELLSANQELEAFSRSVAHDLRAPLRAMQGFSRALIEDYAAVLPQDAQAFAQRIAAAAERMDQLIMDLLSYAQLSRAELQLEPIELRDAVREAKADLVDSAASVVDVTLPEQPLRVLAQRTLLLQVLTNLISNATKFVSAGAVPSVSVTAESRGRYIRVWVHDNGIGIDPRHQGRIFNVFERLHGDESYPGTGIGLAIVRRAVQRMGGTVGVESALGAGSHFWFELPDFAELSAANSGTEPLALSFRRSA